MHCYGFSSSNLLELISEFNLCAKCELNKRKKQMKRPFSMSREDLERIGKQASQEAIAMLKAKKISIASQTEDGKIQLEHPDGTIEIIESSNAIEKTD